MTDLHEEYLEKLNLSITKDTSVYEKRTKLIELKYKRDLAEEARNYLNSIINALEEELEKELEKELEAEK